MDRADVLEMTALKEDLAFEFRATQCTVCGSDDPRPLGWRGGTAHHAGKGVRTLIVRCGACSHLYPNPMPFPKTDLNSLYDSTDEYFINHEIEATKLSSLALIREVGARLGRRGRYLDVGCGRGNMLWAARAEGWDYEGVDPSETFLRWGREHLGVEGRLGTVERVGFPDAHFAAVTMGGVIEHLYDPFMTLGEIWRVLEPGGLLWLDAPNEDGLTMRAANLVMKARGLDWVVSLAPTFAPFHVQGFNPSSLRRLMTRVGFDIEQLRVWGRVFPMTGDKTFGKRLAYQGARTVNWAGNHLGGGCYMALWARKSHVANRGDLPSLPNPLFAGKSINDP